MKWPMDLRFGTIPPSGCGQASDSTTRFQETAEVAAKSHSSSAKHSVGYLQHASSGPSMHGNGKKRSSHSGAAEHPVAHKLCMQRGASLTLPPDPYCKRRTIPTPSLPATRRSTSDTLSHRPLHIAHGQWRQYSRPWTKVSRQPKPTPPRIHSRIAKTSKREDHRTRQLNLRKLQSLLLLSW